MHVTTAACGRRRGGGGGGGGGCGGATIMVALCAMCLLEACCTAAHGQAEPLPQQQPTSAETTQQHHQRPPSHDDAANTELLRQVLMKKCLHRYTMTCLKLDLVRLIDRLGTTRAYRLVPGVSLVRSADGNHTVSSQHNQQKQPPQRTNGDGNGIPATVIRSLVRSNESADELDGYLMEKMDAYLNSLSISVKLIDSTVVENVRKYGSKMLANILPTNLLETGRGKKHGMHAALWSAGTLAAIVFAALAALSGKALMTAMLALALAAMCALKGHGGGGGGGSGNYGKTSHYEIITKPAIYDHDHLVHGASYSSAPYSYARHLTMDDGGAAAAYHHAAAAGIVGRIPLHVPPQRVSVVHAAPAHVRPPMPQPPSSSHDGVDGDGDGDDDGGGGGPPSRDGSGPGRPGSGSAGDEDADDDATVGHMSYPLTPITYIPTNNT